MSEQLPLCLLHQITVDLDVIGGADSHRLNVVKPRDDAFILALWMSVVTSDKIMAPCSLPTVVFQARYICCDLKASFSRPDRT